MKKSNIQTQISPQPLTLWLRRSFLGFPHTLVLPTIAEFATLSEILCLSVLNVTNSQNSFYTCHRDNPWHQTVKMYGMRLLWPGWFFSFMVIQPVHCNISHSELF